MKLRIDRLWCGVVVLALLISSGTSGVEAGSPPAAPVLSPQAQPAIDFQEILQLGGSWNNVALDGDYTYVAGTAGLQVVNIADPENPSLAGHYFATSYYDVEVEGNYAYLADASGLTILDISDPNTPTLVSTLAVGAATGGVTKVGNYLYLADSSDYLHIIDVTQPLTPTEYTYIGGNQNLAGNVDRVGNYLYAPSAGGGCLVVMDVTDPTTPTGIGSCSAYGNAAGVDVKDNLAYVADAGNGIGNFRVVDVSEPMIPTLLTSTQMFPAGYELPVDVAAEWSYAYLATFSGGLRMIDVTDPAHPVQVADFDYLNGTGVAARDGYIYLTDSGGFFILRPTSTLWPDITVDGLEVTQGIQDLANDMPLVEERATAVRAYVRSDKQNVTGVHARLRAYRNGTELARSPINAQNTITVRTDGGTRTRLNDSFWFYLPPEWRSGDVTLKVEVNYDGAAPERDRTNNSLDVPVSFHPGQDINLVTMPLALHDYGSSFNPTLTFTTTAGGLINPDFASMLQRLYRFHPVARVHWQTAPTLQAPSVHGLQLNWDLYTDAGQGDLLNAIRNADLWSTTTVSPTHRLGMVHPDIDTNGGLGLANVPGYQFWVKMLASHAGQPDWYQWGGNSMAHELGHNMGLRHVDCAHAEAQPDPNYPWPWPNCRLAAVDPAGYYGFDVYYQTMGYASPVVLSNDPNDATHQAFPLMGYRRPRWISPWEDCKLLNTYGVNCAIAFGPQNNIPQDSVQSAVEANPSAFAEPDRLKQLQQATDYLVASGLITPTDNTAAFETVYKLPNPSASALQAAADQLGYLNVYGPQTPMTYTLVQLDGGSTVLDSHTISLNTQDGGDVQPFFEVTPLMTGTVRVQLREGANTLAERVASSHVPTVTLISPNGGGVLTAGTAISWTASDLDADELSFNLLYSADNGSTWRTIALGVTGDSYTLTALDGLPGSSQGLMRVVVSDGFYTALDDSDGTFQVPDAPPAALIVAPPAGSRFLPDSLVVLQGLAVDTEDGTLAGSALNWSSDRDGNLGSGEELATNSLSRGWHTIELSATDSQSHTITQTVSIFIGYNLFLPLTLK
jgi:hypothetical protein